METIVTFKKSAKNVSTGKFGLHCNIQHGLIPALETQVTETRDETCACLSYGCKSLFQFSKKTPARVHVEFLAP